MAEWNLGKMAAALARQCSTKGIAGLGFAICLLGGCKQLPHGKVAERSQSPAPPKSTMGWLACQRIPLGHKAWLQELRRRRDREVQQNPNAAAVWFDRGIVLEALQQPSEALASYDTAARLAPQRADIAFRQGCVLVYPLEETRAALAAFDRAIALGPNYGEAWYQRGRVLYSAQRYADAVRAADRALALRPQFGEALVLRGIALLHGKRWIEALATFDRAVALAPRNYYAWSYRADTLGYLGRFAEGLDSVDRALWLKRNDPLAWYVRGELLVQLGKSEEAIASYDMALSLDPDYTTARTARDVVVAARTSVPQ